MPQERRSRIGNGFGARLMADSALIEKGGTPDLDCGAPPCFDEMIIRNLVKKPFPFRLMEEWGKPSDKPMMLFTPPFLSAAAGVEGL